MAEIKRKVFISYYHHDDEEYRDEFEELFGHLFINKSVNDGDIDSDLGAKYIKRLIQAGYLTDTSVQVVLIGENTWKRKYVDWEISAAISTRVGGVSGLLGLLLPTYPGYKENKYTSSTLPPRFHDNLESGYAKLYKWTESETNITKYINDAFDRKSKNSDLIKNGRLQFERNRS
ncbi:TIR domain-containing protein [Geobacter sp. SVR]|uniref:TIR domain-containing protein n=1 Tax=Geobacter sp. SVR TaxID=2495594 RepID=UPI00143EF7E3|nr:TIR domain-containing protein [Geobacter sp. SVR]BCS54326.1 hypothetical protein GSVR_26340 [Geobacter sp. SVR]GCF85815.1 hypothetical protein GSbR_24150 [Geobacter sp. SVR]